MECAIAHHECNSLCNVCNAAIFGEAKCRISTKKGTGHLPHHPSLHGLFDAAQDGCYICSIVWQNINHDSSIPYQPNQATKSKESSIANGTSLLSLKEEHEVVPGGGALFKLDIIVSAPMASWSPKDTRFRIIPTTGK